MKKKLLVSSLFFALGISPVVSQATTFTFTPNDKAGTTNDVFDLDHNFIYFWAVNWSISSIPATEQIKSATLTFKNIYNWDRNENWLKISLLDDVKLSDTNNSLDIISIGDNQGTGANSEIPKYEVGYDSSTTNDKFQDFISLNTWHNLPGLQQNAATISYSFDAFELTTLASYLSTANIWGSTTYSSTFGIGIDPDCHFYNEGITLTIETASAPTPPAPVPEPATMLLLGTGLVGLASARRNRA